MRAQKAQSTVEYILLVTAVIVVIILFTTGQKPGSFQYNINQVLNTTSQEMLNVANRLSK